MGAEITIAMFVFILTSCWPLIIIALLIKKAYDSARGLSYGKRVVTREKITYYESCPHCGAPLKERRDTCEFCGASMIKSKEVITEKDAQKDKEIRKHKNTGVYHYGSSPNVYISVHSTRPKVPITRSTSSSSRSSGSSRSSSHSCAHSHVHVPALVHVHAPAAEERDVR